MILVASNVSAMVLIKHTELPKFLQQCLQPIYLDKSHWYQLVCNRYVLCPTRAFNTPHLNWPCNKKKLQPPLLF